jgi:hypothetical protein
MYVFRELQGVPRTKQLRKHCLKERREYYKLTEEAAARTVCRTALAVDLSIGTLRREMFYAKLYSHILP